MVTRAEAIANIVRRYGRYGRRVSAADRDRVAAELVGSLRALGVTDEEIDDAVSSTRR